MRPICLGFVAVAKTSKLGGAGQEVSVGPSLTLGLGHMCGSGKVVEGIVDSFATIIKSLGVQLKCLRQKRLK